jgi:hypothetical protein
MIRRHEQSRAYLDDRNDKAGGFAELLHVDSEVFELVVLGPLQDHGAALPNRIDAPQISSRVDRGIWSSGELDLGNHGWHRHVAVARRCRTLERRG